MQKLTKENTVHAFNSLEKCSFSHSSAIYNRHNEKLHKAKTMYRNIDEKCSLSKSSAKFNSQNAIPHIATSTPLTSLQFE